MADLTLAARLTADASGFVGGVRASRKELEDLDKAAANTNQRGLRGLRDVTREAKGELDALAARSGAAGRALSSLGAVGSVAAIGLAAVAAAMAAGVKEAAEEERRLLRLDAVLKATGSAAGLTRSELTGLVDELKNTTLASEESALDAAGVLLTFRNVQGEVFKDVLRAAQDMAAVFGGDLRGHIVQLGKAFQDPVEGLTALRRVGISFTDSQEQMIKALVASGRQLEAHKIILAELQAQVGGAGAAEASGLIGSVNRLSKSWSDLLETLGKTPGVMPWVQGTVDFATNALNALNQRLSPDGQIEAARREVARLESQPFAASRERAGRFEELTNARRHLAELELRRVGTMLDEQERLRANDGVAQLRGAAAPPKPDQKLLDALKNDEKIVADLKQSIELFGNAREQAISQAIGRLSEHATGDQILLVGELAGRLHDEKAAQDLANAARSEGLRLFQETRTPAEALGLELERLAGLHAKGAIDADTYGRAVNRAFERLDTGAERARDSTEELTRAFEGFGRRSAKQLADMAVGLDRTNFSLGRLVQTLASEVIEKLIYERITGPLARLGGSALDSLFAGAFGGADVSYAASAASIQGSYDVAAFAPPFHGGGIVGADAARPRAVPASLFARAPRFHTGRQPWLGPGETPAILSQDEGVFTPEQMRRLAPAGGTTVQIIDQRGSGAPVTAESGRGPDGRELIRILVRDEVRRGIERGSYDDAMRGTYGVARQPVRRG